MSPNYSQQDDPCPDPTRPKRRISFNIVEIREYNRILSDNPATTNGPPVGLGWNYSPEDTLRIDLETYESFQCNARRSKRQLAIPSQVRQEMLLEEGYSRGEIARTVREIRKIREQRNVSFHHIKYDPIAEKVESLKRGVKGIIPGKRILPGMKSKKLESPSLVQFSSKGA
mmetsp:Transcript_16041/g.22758  ORF Transcript_16041/g.22758 Transcript_16041/m.22758 type:complete len:171 (+) Transcript_16041:83-595(+)|eukprot:CAMPEP_0201695450 /NCGR_PEP_ID=MMETSP0578-20130828/7393_1 /ASSEMBLY_ACC=CAM_ASM_000663 /TAXON_ID=267565 /ORGANISM="Skeletonema grethea, Strain CCMP 1804" /LENGTH=170 /DNA_ID=CAMNT_0048181295 /DNA_START=108 /DNA_END=620 /DNA_ORIENTATION=-